MAMHQQATIPENVKDLLDGPLYATFVTMRADGAPQASPWWFDFDGEFIRLTHVTDHEGYANITANRNVAIVVSDPKDSGRYLEVRGEVAAIERDPEGDYFIHLSQKYGKPATKPLASAPKRAVISVRVIWTTSYQPGITP
ncbi:MAG: class probable F420-dependent enzyme [Microbacteriaceae bacterium]|nr:class probable F420-dependent enzyme [Microbacteriaceae bacterium]